MVQQDMIGGMNGPANIGKWIGGPDWRQITYFWMGLNPVPPYIAVAHTMPQVSKRVSSLVRLVLTLKTNNRMSLPDSDY